MALCRILPNCLLLNRQKPDWKQKIKLRYEVGGFYGYFSNNPASRDQSAFSWSMTLGHFVGFSTDC